MVYQVEIEESEEGFAVSVPALPGCCSQGDSEPEALENISIAIREYLDVQMEMATARNVRLVAVEV